MDHPIVCAARATCACVFALAASSWCLADAAAANAWRPSGVFVQAGTGRDVASLALGATWDWNWQHDIGLGRLTATTEVLAAEWFARAPSREFTQVGILPMLRLYPREWDAGWFVEGGIGANAITPRYRNHHSHFSTTFNFNVPFGMGRRFGRANEHEVVVRFEHFSNGGIRQPNPGENFLQARYARRF